MDTRKKDLADLLAYNDWANRRMFEALEALSADQWTRELGGSFGNVQETAAHLVAAEWIWLERWKGSSPSSPPTWMDSPAASTLAEVWETIAAERERWMASHDDGDVTEELSYRRLGGEPQSSRLDVLVRHVVNHSSYHRGQLAAFLRMLGDTPPATDLVLWDRSRPEGTSTSTRAAEG